MDLRRGSVVLERSHQTIPASIPHALVKCLIGIAPRTWHPAEMKLLRLVATLNIITLVIACAGCRKRSTPSPTTGEEGPTAARSTPDQTGSSAKVPPGIPVPTEKPWAQRTPKEKHETYIFWLSQLKAAKPDQQSRIIGTIRANGLTPADRVELEKLRQLYNVPAFTY